MNRITNEQREAIVREAIGKRDAHLADCAGGSPCATCPDKRKCSRGCVRQQEFISPSVHALETLVRLQEDIAAALASPTLPAPVTPAAQGVSSYPQQLSEFQEGQWWIKELDAMVEDVDIYKFDQKRAVAVVHHMLRSIAEGVSEPVEQPAAYRADWPNWRQWHDETDPLPRKWDGEVPTITPLFTRPKKGGDAVRALTDEQITEIASGYADGISFYRGQEWAIAFNACAFGLSRRDFSGSGAGGAT